MIFTGFWPTFRLWLVMLTTWQICAANIPPATSDDIFDLTRTIDTVMQNSFQIISATEENHAAQAKVKQALSAYYPQINVAAEYRHFTYVPVVALGSTSLPFGTANGFDTHVGLQMKIYDFGKTSSAVAASRIKSEIAADNTDLVRQKLSFDTIRYFYAILLLRKSIEVQDTELADQEQNRRLMLNRVRAGAATRYDVINADVRIALSKSRRIDLVNSLTTQKIQLNRLLGRDEKKPLNIVGTLHYAKTKPDETALLSQGMQKRLEIAIARRYQSFAEEELRHAQRALLPDLYAGGTAGYRNNYPFNFDQMHANSTFGMKIEAPIFSGFHDMTKIEEQRAHLKSASANYEDVRIGVRADIVQSIKDLLSDEEKIAAADAQVEQARDAARRSLALYNAGNITSREMLDARTTLLQVELMRLQSLYAYILADYNVKRAAGEKLYGAAVGAGR